MNYRHLLLLHVPLGLKLSSNDVNGLTSLLLDPFDLSSVLSALSSKTAKNYLSRRPDWRDESMRILERGFTAGIRWVDMFDPDYPASWRHLSCMPVIFSYQGEPLWKTRKLISIVGSRTPSADTLCWMQRELTEFFKRRDVGVVSGGARGVDQWAHRLCMDAGRPTICVLPTGLLNPYPFGHEEFWRRILDEGGCLMSTCSLNERLKTEFFHIRNRWIAGLSELVFVVEANRRSGSSLTAKLAMEEHKTVCTLPVFPTATQGLGNLDLMFSGAMFVRDHLDLAALTDYLCPTPLQNLEGEEEEDGVDQPQADSGWKPAVLCGGIGSRETHPIADQKA